MRRLPSPTLASLLPFALLVFGCSSGAAEADVSIDPTTLDPQTKDLDVAPTGRGGGVFDKSEQAQRDAKPGSGGGGSSGGTTTSNGIFYHGGPVMTAPANVYYVWYGGWEGNTAVDILSDLAANIGGSPWFGINTTYADGSGAKVPNAVALAGSTTDAYSAGTALSDAAIRGVVSNAIASGALPKDPNGVYFVLTSADVTATSGFCTSYCGWHAHASIDGTDIKYAFVGDGSRCPSACAAQTTSPNGNMGADAMASVVAHELSESVTDPDLDAWYDRRGYENADKCAWTFGTTTKDASGAKYNVTFGTRNFLIQRNWVNASGGYCALAF